MQQTDVFDQSLFSLLPLHTSPPLYTFIRSHAISCAHLWILSSSTIVLSSASKKVFSRLKNQVDKRAHSSFSRCLSKPSLSVWGIGQRQQHVWKDTPTSVKYMDTYGKSVQTARYAPTRQRGHVYLGTTLPRFSITDASQQQMSDFRSSIDFLREVLTHVRSHTSNVSSLSCFLPFLLVRSSIFSRFLP